jgi:N6-L-threonylcarbamoyladenine synthase
MTPPVRILGIETSCDETAAAVVESGRILRSNVVASQEEIHARYGGIVPELASRQHIRLILPVIDEALRRAGVDWADLAAIAVTYGPGLAGSLLVGLNVAKALAFARGLPLVGVNHLEGHVYANWIEVDGSPEPQLPLLCLIVSGAHSDLTLMVDHGQFRRIGRTRDDAAGEAFDKVARLLGLGFPGGPAIQRAAELGNPGAFPLPRAELKDSWDFSFSGLKTATLRLVDRLRREGSLTEQQVADIAASFQEAVVDMLVAKMVAAARAFGVPQVALAGGVAANRRLRERLRAECPVPVIYPPPFLCTDNGAMIAAAGYFRFRAGDRAGLDLDVVSNLKLE